ncbi:MAG: hypothetical protein CMJ25_04825 [Phycisphaerae bacterium]|nr:hypothetical protein [Phycisphaerae bacterium]
MPDSTIEDGSDYFNTVTYSGTGSSLSIPVGFIPNFTWIKRRNAANNHQAFDVLRGSNVLVPNENGSESDYSAYFDFSDSDGFDLPAASVNMNNSSGTYVAWNWLANGSGVSNTVGTTPSTVSANTTAGFSIVSYTGNSTSGATVGHGLSIAPEMVIVKLRSGGTNDWAVYHYEMHSSPQNKLMYLNLTNAVTDSSSPWNDTAPTSSVITLGSGNITNGTTDYIAYCFHSVEGYSSFGSYTGNGSADGPFVYTGFRPAFVMVKKTSGTGSWYIYDLTRLGYNGANYVLAADSSTSEISGKEIDLLSNGFKWRNTTNNGNASGGTYIYMAFAENPFKNANAR